MSISLTKLLGIYFDNIFLSIKKINKNFLNDKSCF